MQSLHPGINLSNLLAADIIAGFLIYLQGLVLKYQYSVTHAEAVEKNRIYLKWVRTLLPQRPDFAYADWLGSEATRVLASPESPMTFVDMTLPEPSLAPLQD